MRSIASFAAAASCLSSFVVYANSLNPIVKASVERTRRALQTRDAFWDHAEKETAASNARRAQELGEGENCDKAFFTCLSMEQCATCFIELQFLEIDWTTVTKEQTCSDVLKILTDKGHCEELATDQGSKDTFCSTFDSCIHFPDNDSNTKKNTTIDCDALTECNWEGFHPSFVGDGTCQDGIDGCYNTAICNYDGGDCCPDTCNDNAFLHCDHDGFNCKDPNSNYTVPKDDDHGVDPAKIDCDKTLYRLIMYDSFGDGWGNTEITIESSNGHRIFQGGLTTGNQGVEYLCLDIKDSSCYHVDVRGGVWGKEVSWQIKPVKAGSPSLAGGGAPMSCDFSPANAACETPCDGKPNIPKTNDPDYVEFKHMYECIDHSCPIQVGACANDPICKSCFVEDTEEYCFASDLFGAVIDCTLCQCTPNKDSEFCWNKQHPGAPAPTPKDKKVHQPCSPAEVRSGSNAVIRFGSCTQMTEVVMTVTNFDNNNFGALDAFEACAREYKDRGLHTALECTKILFDAMQLKTNTPVNDAVQSLAWHLYTNGHNFCECAYDSSLECPICPGFKNFKTLLWESLDACQALDDIDCAAWQEFASPCKDNIINKFGKVDFTREQQCGYVMEGCGGTGPFPAFRRLDCDGEIPKESWDFYNKYSVGCLEKDANGNPVVPHIPSHGGSKPYIPTPYNPDFRPHGPREENKNYRHRKQRKRRRFFWSLFLVSLIGVGFYYYQRRKGSEFSFVGYRRAPAWADDENYSGLALESNFTPPNFTPPSFTQPNSTPPGFTPPSFTPPSFTPPSLSQPAAMMSNSAATMAATSGQHLATGVPFSS